jgi:type I restriction enzyme S subunit
VSGDWQPRRLGEFISVKHGWAFPADEFRDEGDYIVLTPGNFVEGGGLKLRGTKDKHFSTDFPEQYMLSEKSILVVMTDLIQSAPLLGGAMIVPEDNRFLHNQRLGLVQTKGKEPLDRGFLYYLLNSPDYKAQVRASATGATVRHTAPTRIENCRVTVPSDSAEQRAIAEILEWHDAAIFQASRQIELLQQAAHLIYTEWFIRLHFPGHNRSQRTNDLPSGWHRDRLDSILTLQRGFDLPAEQRMDGDIPIIASTGVCGTHSISKVSGPGVVSGRSGTLGKVHLVLEDFWPLNTTLWVKEYRGISPYFAYFLLQGLNLASLNVGASVPSLDRNTVHPLPIIVPDAMTLAKFDEIVIPIFQQIDMLERQIKQLKSARDLLLPRLISGQLRL